MGKMGLSVYGLVRLSENIPDLIMCDVMMPIMDGYQFCQVIKAHPSYQKIRLIMMSAGATLSKKECGFQAFIQKPFDVITVVETVANLLQ
jgi:CheY-like chemotaxis protein